MGSHHGSQGSPRLGDGHREALVVLRFSPRSAAVDIAKVIKSAAANAEHNYNLDASSLRVARVEVDGAMIIKRWRAKPRGMAGSIFKRTSHLRAFVTDDEAPANVRRRRAVKMPRTVVPAPVVTPAATATPAANVDAPAATPRPARRRAPKPTTEEAE
jgi:large subunit ribosomal protein L22